MFYRTMSSFEPVHGSNNCLEMSPLFKIISNQYNVEKHVQYFIPPFSMCVCKQKGKYIISKLLLYTCSSNDNETAINVMYNKGIRACFLLVMANGWRVKGRVGRKRKMKDVMKLSPNLTRRRILRIFLYIIMYYIIRDFYVS